MKKRWVAIGTVCVLAIVGGGVWVVRHLNNTAPTVEVTKQQTPTQGKKPVVNQTATKPASFNKQAYSTSDPASLWVVVNKQHPITPSTYAPSDLRKPAVTLRVPGATEMQLHSEAALATEKLFAGADTAGYKLQVSTAYRGYAYQKTLYDSYVAESGQAAADTFSARPGYSEHQTGWSLDIRTADNQCPLETCFGDLPEGKWLAANAYQYGFILRYPADKTPITGYSYEPWHFRYVGTALATQMHTQGIETMEEFFGVSGGTSYE